MKFSILALVFFTQLSHAELETFAEFGPETPVGNISIGSEGRLFVSLHHFYSPKHKVVVKMNHRESIKSCDLSHHSPSHKVVNI